MAYHEDADIERSAQNVWEYLKDVKKNMSVFRWVLRELIGEESKRWIRSIVIALVCLVTLEMVQPWLVRFIFDGLLTSNTRWITIGFCGLVFCRYTQIFCHYLQAKAREWILGLIIGRTDQRICELFFEKSLGQHLQESSTLHVANIEKGRERVINIMGQLLFEGIQPLLEIMIAFLFLWFISPAVGLLMTLVIGIYVAWSLYLNQQVVEVCTPIERDFRRLNRYLVERLNLIERVKTSDKEREEVRTITDRFDRVIKEDRAFWLWFNKEGGMRSAVHNTASLLVIGYGIWRVWEHDWTIGMLYPLLSWNGWIVSNLWRIGYIEHHINWNVPAVRSMIEALTLESDIADKETAVMLSQNEPLRIEFKSVTHTYPLSEREERVSGSKKQRFVLKDVSFSIEPGEKVALIGSSGAGKTTIMRLLQRYMDPDEGSIFVNDIDLRDAAISSWKRQLSYVPQQAMVFDGTIHSNLVYGLTPDQQAALRDEDLWHLVRLLQIDFKERLVNGLDTRVGRNGIKLSGGEAQRLMVGAAAIRKPRIMIIDEATSSLDSTTEKAVQRGLAEVLSKDMSALIITHRLSTVRHLCTKFIMLKSAGALDNGDAQIEAIANSFEELYLVSPAFRQLADDQGIKVSV